MENEMKKKLRLSILRSEMAKKRARGPTGVFIKNDVSLKNESFTSQVVPAKQNQTLLSNAVISEDKNKPSLTSEDPPLVDVKVTNPIAYLKRWWRRVIGNEGIEMRASLKIKPLTAFLLLTIIFSGGVTISLINRIKDTTPVGQYIPAFGSELPSDRFVTGTVGKVSGEEYYLVAGNEAILLLADKNINLGAYEGKKVIVKGKFSDLKKSLLVEEIKEFAN